MSRRALLIIAGVVVVLTVVAAAAAFFLRSKSSAPAAETPSTATTTPLRPAGGLPTPATTTPPVTTAGAGAAQTFSRASDRDIIMHQLTVTAGQFAERFGTYSNQADFQNLIDLFPLMTVRFRDATERTIAQARTAGTAPEEYVGVVTRTVTAKLPSLDDRAGRVTATVTAQRATQTGSDVPTTRYQTLTIEFRLTGGVWLVDSATWSTP